VGKKIGYWDSGNKDKFYRNRRKDIEYQHARKESSYKLGESLARFYLFNIHYGQEMEQAYQDDYRYEY
jgi:SAM-dependent MidA family methyltransferase